MKALGTFVLFATVGAAALVTGLSLPPIAPRKPVEPAQHAPPVRAAVPPAVGQVPVVVAAGALAQAGGSVTTTCGPCTTLPRVITVTTTGTHCAAGQTFTVTYVPPTPPNVNPPQEEHWTGQFFACGHKITFGLTQCRPDSNGVSRWHYIFFCHNPLFGSSHAHPLVTIDSCAPFAAHGDPILSSLCSVASGDLGILLR